MEVLCGMNSECEKGTLICVIVVIVVLYRIIGAETITKVKFKKSNGSKLKKV